ncbi:hypothetical protein B0H13DRAFT_695752 [Mycena leptocephala]|nr:hypothetical protein B0H13DRAFT_695752 [Mycena leptocephala]
MTTIQPAAQEAFVHLVCEPDGSKPRRPVLKRVTADAQTSLTLDSSLVASSFTRNGQEADSETVTASLTSFNNFINFCATVDVPITNGKQLIGGSCNPAPMGLIPTSGNLPAVLINQPTKGTTIAANTTIPLEFFVNNLQSGVVVDVATNFLSAPQQLDSTGNILGHYHVVIEELDALNSTVPTDARNFAFFSVIKDAASNGEIVSEVTNGLPEGFYRMTATIHAANHQPVLVPIAQHGALIDVAYFTVTADGSEGSTPSVRRRAPPHVYTPHPSETQARRKVVTRADDAAQSSLSLLSSVIAPGFANDGQDIPQAATTS